MLRILFQFNIYLTSGSSLNRKISVQKNDDFFLYFYAVNFACMSDIVIAAKANSFSTEVSGVVSHLAIARE